MTDELSKYEKRMRTLREKHRTALQLTLHREPTEQEVEAALQAQLREWRSKGGRNTTVRGFSNPEVARRAANKRHGNV